MKEKLQKYMDWMKQNRKKTALIGLAAVLILGAAGFGIAELNRMESADPAVKADSPKVTASGKADTEKDKAEDKEDEKKSKEDEKKSEDDDKKEDEKSDKKAEDSKKETEKKDDSKTATTNTSKTDQGSGSASGGSTGGGSSSGGSTGGGNSSGGNTGGGSGSDGNAGGGSTQTPTPPAQPDPPAHVCSFTEAIYGEKPETQMVAVTRCSGCNKALSEISLTESLDDHAYNHMINGQNGGTYGTWEEQPTGNMIPYVTGYKCSCGAVQYQ